MPKFVKKSGVVEATQWFKNGDHPDDGPRFCETGPVTGFPREGSVVNFYRYYEPHKNNPCLVCGNKLHEHGWVDSIAGGVIVCPGDFIMTCSNGKYWPYNEKTFYALYYTHREYAEILSNHRKVHH